MSRSVSPSFTWMSITKSHFRLAFGLAGSALGAMIIIGTILGTAFPREPVSWETVASLGGLGLTLLESGIAFLYDRKG